MDSKQFMTPNGWGMPGAYPSVQNNQPTNFTTFNPSAQQTRQTIPCWVVGPGEQIQAKDVPMDTPSLFLAQDGSFIIGKEWNNQGGIDDVIFLPVKKDQENDKKTMQTEEFGQIMARLDALTDMIEMVYKNNNHISNQTQKKYQPNNKNNKNYQTESEVTE